jgi:chromosome segregation ATPase
MLAVPPFGLFKKKDGKGDASPAEQPAISAPAAGALSIQQAQELLQKIESARVQELAARLAPVRDSADRSLKVIGQLADDMENEKIKLEDLEQRFKSIVENSRRTVVASLRREASTELELPQSVNDAKKFKEKFETMIARLGQVSGSHSKVINNFMKKHAGRMKGEFESLHELLDEIKSAMSDFDQKRSPVIKCNNVLNTALQKVSSIRSGEADLQNLGKDVTSIEEELERLRSELAELKKSPEYSQESVTAQKAGEAEAQEQQFRAQVRDLFSHVSRAFTKYSYGITRETERRLQAMSDEPWKIFYESDISPYSLLLLEIRKSIDGGKVQLKDSDKMLGYLDNIIESLPELQSKAQSLKADIDLLRQSGGNVFHRVVELEEREKQLVEELSKNRQAQEQQQRQIAEKSGEVDSLLKEAGEILYDLTGQRYSIQY